MFKILIIYYMYTSLASLRDANSDLKAQLRKDKADSSVLEHGNFAVGSNTAVNPTVAQADRKQVKIQEPCLDETHRMRLLKELQDVIDTNNIGDDKDEQLKQSFDNDD